MSKTNIENLKIELCNAIDNAVSFFETPIDKLTTLQWQETDWLNKIIFLNESWKEIHK